MAVRIVVVAYEEFPDDQECESISTMDVAEVTGKDLIQALVNLKYRLDDFVPIKDIGNSIRGLEAVNTAVRMPTTTGGFPVVTVT